MIITVSSAKALQSAVRSAEAGDTILLKSGLYGALRLDDLEGVTIAAASGARPVFTALKVNKGEGLRLEGLEIDLSRGGTFAVLRSQEIDLVGLNVHGSLDGNPRNDGGGLMIRSSSDVRVVDSEFSQLKWGLGHLDVKGLVVRDNEFHDLRVDGVRGGGSSNLVISGNQFRDFHPSGRDHPDAIQLWTTNTKAPARDILIENNYFLRGDGAAVQGIFLRDQVGDLPYEQVVIRGNLVAGGAYNGIVVNGGRSVAVEDNIVQGFVDMKSWIRFIDVKDGTISDNATNLVLLQNTRDVVETGTEILLLAADRGAAALDRWIEQGGATPPAQAPDGGAPDRGAPDRGPSDRGPSDRGPSDRGPPDDEASDAPMRLIEGGDARDYLQGDAQENLMRGRGGADTLQGGGGDDTLVGGAGADRFAFEPGCGDDHIRDLGRGDAADVIDASALLNQGAVATLSESVHGVTIDFSSGESIFVEGVALEDLRATADGWIFS